MGKKELIYEFDTISKFSNEELASFKIVKKLTRGGHGSEATSVQPVGCDESDLDSGKDSTLDSLNLYLKDISKNPLLTASQEKELAERMEQGDAKARERLIVSNLRLVVFIVNRWMRNWCEAHKTFREIDYLDLIQDGNIALMRAVDTFDCTLGYRLSTHAARWIYHAILRAYYDKGYTIRIPVHVHELLNKLHSTYTRLCQQLFREPTSTELAEAMNLKVSRVEELLSIKDMEPLSLDAVCLKNPNAEDDFNIDNYLADKAAQDPMEFILQQDLSMAIDRSMSDLSDREQRILRARYGLHMTTPMTLEEIGQREGFTRERIRQINHQALVKLKESQRRKYIEDFAC